MGNFAPGFPEKNGMVDAWGRNDIPGTAGQRTSLESIEVADEVGEDHFHDFVW